MQNFLNFVRSPRFAIFMIVFVDVLGLGIIIPVLPLFAQNQLGAAAWQITALTSVFFTAQFFASPWLGKLSDRVGRRPVLIVSQIGTLLAFLITGLAPSMIFIFIARLIDGFTGGNVSVAQAYLSDITDEKNRARGLGIVNASFGLGFVFGPAFGGLLASIWGPRVPFFVAACVSLATILLSIFLLPESLPLERRKREQAIAKMMPRKGGWSLVRIPSVATLLLVAFTSTMGFLGFQSIYVLWAERMLFNGLPQATVQQSVGWILAFVGISSIVAQFWLVGPLVKRFGEMKLVVSGNFVRAIVFCVMALAPTVIVQVSIIPFLAISSSVALPALIALLTYAAPPDGRGQVIGLFQSVSAIGSIIGPLLAGFLFQNVHPNAPMVAVAVLLTLTTMISLNLFRLQIYKQPAPQQVFSGGSE